jgi:hypothetical protein
MYAEIIVARVKHNGVIDERLLLRVPGESASYMYMYEKCTIAFIKHNKLELAKQFASKRLDVVWQYRVSEFKEELKLELIKNNIPLDGFGV